MPIRNIAIGLLLAALVGIAALVLIPRLTAEPTCHDRIRPGPNSNTSRLDTTLQVPSDQWPQVAQIFRDFAAERGWSLIEGADESADGTGFRWMALCDETATTINVRNVIEDHAVTIEITHIIYDGPEKNAWRAFYSDIHARLEAKWPGKMTYVNGDFDEPDLGLQIARPAWLGPAPANTANEAQAASANK